VEEILAALLFPALAALVQFAVTRVLDWIATSAAAPAR
jgi:hypothetical protein